jgi:hypothetical protein
MNSVLKMARTGKAINVLGATLDFLLSRYLTVLLIGVIFSALVVSAQVNTGTISGVVQDSSGAVIAGATVTVKNVDTGTVRTLTSDAGGRYIAPVLPVGNYEVRGEQSGFQTEIRSGITLTVGREEVINLTLRVGQVASTIEVTAEAPLVETTTAAMSSLVDERTIRDLPLNGRSYDQLALTQPGVVSVGAGQASVAFDYGTGTRFNVNGSRAYANTFLLDGTVLNDHANATPGGAAGNNLGVDGVQEFKINTSVSPAEYGRSTGGVISAVTRSGTNSLHGSAFGFLRNSALDSLGFFDYPDHNNGSGKVAPYRRGQFGGSLGGPIKKDKTFYFGTYEGLRQGNGTIIAPNVPTAQTKLGIVPFKAFQGTDPAKYNCHKGDTACIVPVSNVIKPYLDLFQDPSPGTDNHDGTGVYNAAPLQVTGENYFMTRVDHQISENMRIFVRYSLDRDTNALPNFNGSAVADEHDLAHRQYSTIQVNNTLRTTLVNSFRVAFNRTYQNFDDVISNPKVANLPNGGSFAPGQHFGTISFGSQGLSTQPLNFIGIDNGAPRVYRYNSFQEGDDLTYVRGAHAFKWGVNIERIQDNEITESNTRGDYTFLDIPAFLTNTPLGYQAASPGASGSRGLRTTLFGAYAQDDFRVTQRLTLNLGLRWEVMSNPTEANGKMANLLNITDATTTVLKNSYFSVGKKDFQPRVGLAWRLNGSGTTVLRAGFGMFHDHVLPYSYVGWASGVPPFFSSLNDPAPVFPIDTNFTNPNLAPPPAQFDEMPATLKEPSKTQYTLSVQQQVMKNTVLEVAYIGSESHHLQIRGEGNPIAPINGVFPAAADVTACQKSPALPGCRVNPNFASLPTSRFDGNADYNALQVILRRRSSSGLQYQVFYTYSKSLDTKSSIAGGETRQEPNTVLDFLNPGLDRGRSSFDARHNLVPTITYPLPFKFQQKAVEMIAGGWTVNGIATFRTGEPFTARVGSNLSQNGDRWSPDRPNLNAGFSNDPTSGVTQGCAAFPKIAPGTPLGTWSLWYDPCAFSNPTPGTYGNLGRNTITGPRLFNVDFSADKNFKLTERINMQFRAEIFNLLDEAHFYEPVFNLNSGSAGKIKTLISSPGGRLIQFGLKVMF